MISLINGFGVEFAMAESLVGVMLRSRRVHKEPWVNHESQYKKVHDERIKQGNFGHVYRMRHIDPDGAQTLVVFKEVRHNAKCTQEERHELECIRRLNEPRFRGHAIQLLF